MTSGVVNYSGRSFFIQLVFLACFLLLLSRLIYIQVFQDDFIKKQLTHLDKYDGNIDTLTNRISNIRTWSYVANKRNWVDNSDYWIEASKNIKFYKDLLIKNKKVSTLFNTKLYVKNFEKSLECAHANLIENKKENIYVKN